MLVFPPVDTWRWIVALSIVFGYAALCARQYFYAGAAVANRFIASVSADNDIATEKIWVIYASQTGQAEDIASQTAHALSAAHRQINLRRIEDDWQSEVAHAHCVLFVVSTYGEGSAPDHALRFAHAHLKGAQAQLPGMRYGLLALGDRDYPAFCAFGRQLDAWLQASGAMPLFDRIDVDRLDAEALSSWQRQLNELGAKELSTPRSAAVQDYSPWRFVERQCLNTGSLGSPIFLVTLQASVAETPKWQAGDLVDLLVPGCAGHPRAYSIANLPGAGRIELIVRTHIREDGQTGLASGWLNETAQVNDLVSLKLRSNPSFHLQPDLARPLILIGSGTGIAGLRAHLHARAQAMAASGQSVPDRNAWLFFGERSGQHDYLCHTEIQEWQRAQVLSKVDMTFSRDYPVAPYVQDSLLAQAHDVCEWIASGADILICGNAKKMAVGVDKALRRILGSEQVDFLLESGRIRRDVF